MGYRSTTIHGYDLGEVVSAVQKSIRRGDEEAALFWGIEMDRSGYGEYLWKRLRIILSEDIGLAEPDLMSQIRGLYDSWVELRKKKDETHFPERLFVTHALVLMARAKKSRHIDHATVYFYTDAYYDEHKPEVPDVALDKHTLRGKRMKRGWDHFWTEGIKLVNEADIPDPYREAAERAVRGPVAGHMEESGQIALPTD